MRPTGKHSGGWRCDSAWIRIGAWGRTHARVPAHEDGPLAAKAHLLEHTNARLPRHAGSPLALRSKEDCAIVCELRSAHWR